jgi:hypothetical protein
VQEHFGHRRLIDLAEVHLGLVRHRNNAIALTDSFFHSEMLRRFRRCLCAAEAAEGASEDAHAEVVLQMSPCFDMPHLSDEERTMQLVPETAQLFGFVYPRERLDLDVRAPSLLRACARVRRAHVRACVCACVCVRGAMDVRACAKADVLHCGGPDRIGFRKI